MAALQDQPISINYGRGLDTKTNKFTIPTGKLLQLQDAVFTNPMELEKRPGNVLMTQNIFGGGSFSNPSMMSTFNEELLCTGTATGATINGQRLFSYSKTENVWVDKGRYTPVKTESGFISEGTYSQVNPSAAILNNIALFAASDFSNTLTNFGNLHVSVRDMNTNTSLLSDYNPGVIGECGAPLCVTLAGSQLALIYLQYDGSNYALIFQTVTVSSGGGVVFGSPVTIGNMGGLYRYQIASTSSGATIAYTSTTTPHITVVTIDTSGTVTNTATIVPSFSASCLAVAVDSSTNYNWVYWCGNKDSGVFYVVYDSSLGVVTTATTIVPSHTISAPFSTGWITAITTAPHIQQVGMSPAEASSISTSVGSFYQALVNDSGTVLVSPMPAASYPGLVLQSQYFLMQDVFGNNIPYICLTNSTVTTNTLQPTIFAVEASLSSSTGSFGVISRVFAGEANDLRTDKALASPIFLSSTKVLVPASVNTEAISPNMAFEYFTLDFANQDSAQSLSIPNKTLILNGGIVSAYDANVVSEMGFNFYPEIVVTNSTSGGSLRDGTYLVTSAYQYLDNQNSLYQSSPAPPETVVFDSGSNANYITVSVPYLTLTEKPNVGLTVYVTQPNEPVLYLFAIYSGGSLYSNATPNVLTPGFTASYATVTIFELGNIPDTPILYTNGGILDNDPPPPSTAMVIHNNRVQLVDSTNPNSQWYSKSMTPGVGVSFSGNLLNQIDPHAGSIVALAEMDDKLILLAQNAPIILTGDGANDAGQGSTLSFPQFIPSDVGCSQSKGVITSPLGVHVKTPKGLYLLDRSLGYKYWGSPVEKYNSQSITSSIIMPGKTQIRFLTSSGLTLVYDYFQDQWSTFSNFQGVSATIWNGLYVYARSDETIFQEDTSGTYLDNTTPYAVTAQFGWIKGNIIQGFQRLKQLLQLGEYANGSSNGHGLQASLEYDYGTNPSLKGFSTPVSYTFTPYSGASGPFQYRHFLEQQKCEAASILIQEIVTGASGEYLTLTDMTAVLGIKKGAFKLPSNQSVG